MVTKTKRKENRADGNSKRVPALDLDEVVVEATVVATSTMATLELLTT